MALLRMKTIVKNVLISHFIFALSTIFWDWLMTSFFLPKCKKGYMVINIIFCLSLAKIPGFKYTKRVRHSPSSVVMREIERTGQLSGRDRTVER